MARYSPPVVSLAPLSPSWLHKNTWDQGFARHPELVPPKFWVQIRRNQLVFPVRGTFKFEAEQVFIG